jgi:hypothetical protein
MNNRKLADENFKNNTKKMEFDKNEKFSDLFNKNFNQQIKRNIVSNEIQTYNNFNQLSNRFNYENFDYSNMFDNNFSAMEDSFGLLSTNIPEEFNDTRTLEDRIKAYHDNTLMYSTIAKGANNSEESNQPLAFNDIDNVANIDDILN